MANYGSKTLGNGAASDATAQNNRFLGGHSTHRNRGVPFQVLADAFATEDEELEPEPEWFDFL